MGRKLSKCYGSMQKFKRGKAERIIRCIQINRKGANI